MSPDPLRPRLRPRTRSVAVCLALAGSLTAVHAAAAPAALAAPTTVAGPTIAATPGQPAPTEDKPQSKLWYHDGSWWALMRGRLPGATSDDVLIHRLVGTTWTATSTVVDDRATSTGDALWEDGTLYVASRSTSSGDNAVEVVRFRYDETGESYAPLGQPVKIAGTAGPESASIARDGEGRLWVTYTQDSRVLTAHTTTSETDWSTPAPIPGTPLVSVDDISAIVAFDGQVGVMWSDQPPAGEDSSDFAIRFAVRDDDAALDAGWTSENTGLSGLRLADDHVNLKSLLENDGRLYAAVKTSKGDTPLSGPPDAPTDTSIALLTRSGPDDWDSEEVATVAERLTRPQLALDATNDEVYVVMADETALLPTGADGSVYYKKSDLDDLDFPSGKGEVLLRSPGARINNPTTAKAPVTAETGLVVLGSDVTTENKRYYHATIALEGDGSFTGGPGRGADGTFRAAGDDRYETAAELSRESFEPGVPVVYLATGRGYADALAAGPAAARQEGPLLLTDTGELPPATAAELTRLAPAEIVVVGGTTAVSEAVVSAARRIAPTTRVAGEDRYETAAKIADDAFAGTRPSTVYVATGTGFADALAGSAAAGADGVPLLLTDPASVPPVTGAALDRLRPGRIVVVGGERAVSAGAAAQLGTRAETRRVFGDDRYATAAEVSELAFDAGSGTAYLATGEDFPDALAGAAVAAAEDAPLLLVRPGCAPAETVAEARRLGADRIVALGGTTVLSEQAAALQSC